LKQGIPQPAFQEAKIMTNRVEQQFGNYRLVALLGQGSFAEVYLGQHLRLELQAAIKVLHTHLTEQEAAHFSQEAQTIAKLTHPSIVRVFDYDVQDGVPFLVMDYAPNGSLRRRYPKGSVVPLAQIISSVKQVAAALQYAHAQKFIHRDVKPENMLVGRQQEVLVSDFGLAALAHSSGSLSTQEAIGTLAYMAPEQIEGHPRPASDQYALGVVVYEWLCGQRPFEGSATEVMVQQLTMPPPPLHEQVATIPLGIEQVVLRALAKEHKERFASTQDFAQALEQASQPAPAQAMLPPSEQPASGAAAVPSYSTVAVPANQPASAPEAITPTEQPPGELITPQNQAEDETPLLGHFVAPTAAVLPTPLEPTVPILPRTRHLSSSTAVLLIGLAVLVIAGAILGSFSLLTHFGVLSTRSGLAAAQVARGGTWAYSAGVDPGSLIPNGSSLGDSAPIDQALYLPLFYSDAQGVIHTGAATEVPMVQNGGVNANATTWTFHLRPHLVWSDGQPYDARDADFTWKLWRDPKFGAASTLGLDLISSASVSADHLSITFHLKRPFAPFLADLWVDGFQAPLPEHHFRAMPPEAIQKSPENLNPKVVSGPFMMAESVPGDHYTLVGNPRYYRASEGLPYLDKVVFSDVPNLEANLKGLQAGTITSAGFLDVSKVQQYQRLRDYTLIYPPTSASFEAMYFNFHNSVLADHLEVRKAMAMAVDQQALIQQARQGLGTLLCTDHPSAYHPGYDAAPPCPVFDLAAANKLLDDNGWVKGPDGVRAKGGQRLEFEYSTSLTYQPFRLEVESIIQHDFGQIGVKLDIQNYPYDTFFSSILSQGKASPPTGAVAGRYDIAEFAANVGYDPDDSGLFACNQFPPTGFNIDFYCNPALDNLFAQEQATADPGVRQQIFRQTHGIYLTQFPFVVLFSEKDFALAHKGTHNYLPGPYTDTYNIAEWWCDNGKC
jgi:peptide/nickel transport system substrate-binding protein